MTMEKTTDWSAEKEAAAKSVPLSEKVNPNLHKIAKGTSKNAKEIETPPSEDRDSTKS